MRILIAFAVVAALSAPALAQTPPAETATAANADPKDQLICKRQKTPGSRIGSEKVCRTKAEWEQIRIQSRFELERIQNSGFKTGS